MPKRIWIPQIVQQDILEHYVSQPWATLGMTVLIAVITQNSFTGSLNDKLWRREATQAVGPLDIALPCCIEFVCAKE